MSFIIWKFCVTEVGFDEIKKKVVNPFKGQKNRCLLWLPAFKTEERCMAFDNPENPHDHGRLHSCPRRRAGQYIRTAMSAAAAIFP